MRLKKWIDEVTLTSDVEVGADAIVGDDKDKKRKKKREMMKRNFKKKKDNDVDV